MISEELLQSFIAEASDLLDDIEPSLVEYPRIDDVDERTEVVNRVFRHFHSIKGSAGFVGLHDIARLTHEAETLLEQYRKVPDRIIPGNDIALLCRTVDLLRAIFAAGGESVDQDGNELGIDALIGEIVLATKQMKAGSRPTGVMTINLTDSPDAAKADENGPDATQVVDMATVDRLTESIEQSDKANAEKPGKSDKDLSIAPVQDKQSGRSKTSVSQKDTRSRRRSSDTARVIKTRDLARRETTAATNEFAAKYVTEANELLEQIEQSLLQAEQHPDSGSDAIQEALRCLHSFKGNSGFMNLVDLERLSHRMESEVENNIGRSLGLDSQTFDALLQMIDVLRQGVLDFSCGGSGAIPEADAYIVMLDEFGTARDTEVKRHSTQILRLGDTKNATPPAPPPAEKEESKKPAETPTRRLPTPKLDDPRRRVTDTTRLMLRGKTSTQENLAELPKSDNIIISSDLPAGAPATAAAANTGSGPASGSGSGGSSSSTQPRPSDTTKRFRDTRALASAKAGGKDTAAAKSSDTGQKRRTAEQLAARNDIRVDLRKLDSMLDLVGELVIAEAMVTRHPVVWNADNESLERAVHQLRRVASSLQDMATSVRMIPLAPTFRRMTRLVYDLSVKAGKQVDLILLGEDTEVDRTVIERISDPLVHIIRNAIDHGIEPPDERVNLGKPETGRLTIEGHHEGGEVWIIISDDGRGLDREAILRRAISRGLIQGDGSDLTDGQIYHFIFEPGFSTAEKVTDISGRGFGMDVVKKNIEKLSGRIDIRTRPGEGTAVVLRIPLTLAIIDGMLVSSGDTRYIIPLLSIRESLRPDESQIMSTPDGQHMVKLRDELIPIVRLDEIFTRVNSSRSMIEGILMIVEGEDGDVVALFADELLGQQETVIKGLSGWLKRSRGVSGCTILGDGEVGLILDIGAIVRLARQQSIDFDAAAGGRTGA